MASELCPEDTVPEASDPAGFGGGALGRRGVWQRGQPLRQRGSLTILPAPQPLPAKLHNWERDPRSIHSQGTGCAVFPPQRKDSAGPSRPSFSPQSLLSPSSSPRQQGGRGAQGQAPSRCRCRCRCAVREFQATPPRAKVKGCQVPVSSEQVLVDCALGAMQALCQ